MTPSNNALVNLAQHELKARRRRDARFPTRLFADPAWDMLLDLFVSHHEADEISVSSLCVGSGIPQTTALRWIKTLESEGLVIRKTDPRDARRVLVRLTPEAIHLLESLLTVAFQDLRRLLSMSIQNES